MLICGALAWSAYMLTQSLPYWPINPAISSTPGSLSSSTWCGRCGRCCRARFSGARASRWRSRRSPTGGRIPARLVGGVYAANTVGAIVGSLGASLLLVVWLGSQRAQQVLIVISAVSALLMLESAAAEAEAKKSRFQFAGTLLLVAAAMGGAVLLAPNVQPVPGMLVAYGRYAATRSASPTSSTSAKG